VAKKHTGQCACSAVRFEFDTAPTFVATCHCLDCKKASGGEAATFFGVPEDDFTLLSGNPKGFPYVAASGKHLGESSVRTVAHGFTRNLEAFRDSCL
jgi:hypothetical protein